MKNNMKIVKIIACVLLIPWGYNIFSWIRLLLIHTQFEEHLNSMNSTGLTFTSKSLIVNSIGTVLIHAVGVVGSILILREKEIGRKLFIAPFFLFPTHDVIWAIINLFLERKIGVFVLSIILGLISCFIMVKLFDRLLMRGIFEDNMKNKL